MSTKKMSLPDTLFPKVKQKVLKILFCHPHTAFFTNEIIRLGKSGTGSIQRELDKLTHSGLVTMTKSGNQKLYQANVNSPLFQELRSIVIKTFGMADAIKEALEPIVSEITVAFIYGSVARNEDTTESDIDLMLIGDNLTYNHCFQLLAEAEDQLERKVNPTLYTETAWKLKNKSDNNFINKVKGQPKIFLIGTEEQLNELS